jgi:hypothetical protein
MLDGAGFIPRLFRLDPSRRQTALSLASEKRRYDRWRRGGPRSKAGAIPDPRGPAAGIGNPTEAEAGGGDRRITWAELVKRANALVE